MDPPMDLRKVAEHFRNAVQVTEEGTKDVNMDEYVKGFNELNKMFKKFGRLFNFIASDVKEKSEILQKHAQSNDQYKMLRTMINYEKNEAHLLDEGRKQQPGEMDNGCRTLLRLHRAMLFVSKLVESIRTSKDGANVAMLARNAYNESLAAYHGTTIRTLVRVAVGMLPNRKKMIEMLAGSSMAEEEVNNIMQEMVAATNAVYEIVQGQFEQNDLLKLP